MIKLKGADMFIHPLLHFSLVLVSTLGLADAVLPSPVQDLLELLLLSAEKQQNTRVALKQKVKGHFKSAIEACIESDQRLSTCGSFTARPLQADSRLSVSTVGAWTETKLTSRTSP